MSQARTDGSTQGESTQGGSTQGRPAQARRRARTAAGTTAALLLAAGGLALSPGQAHADDIAQLKDQIATAQAQLADLQTKTEQVAEQMNAARIAQVAADRDDTAAQTRLTAVRGQLAGVRASVAAMAVQTYQSSSDKVLALLGSSDPSTFLLRASDLSEVSRSRAGQIAQLDAANKRQADAQTAADTADAHAKAVATQIASAQATIVASVKQQQTDLANLQTREAELVRQAEAAAAKAAADKLAAEQQAAAQAAVTAAKNQQASLAAEQQALAAAPPVVTTPIQAPAPSAPPTTTENAPVDQAPVQVASNGSAGAIALAAAESQIGKPYVYGASGPGSYDCSGLTMWAYAHAGISLAHYTGAQFGEGRHISRGDLQPGDLVFFGGDIGHVGIYAGGGQMVDAPHSGAYVREEPLFGDYAGAVRPGG